MAAEAASAPTQHRQRSWRRGMFLTGTLPGDHTAAQGWCSGLIGQQELR